MAEPADHHRDTLVESLFQGALDQGKSERESWLRASCHDDETLFAEVTKLLAHFEQAETGFLDPERGGPLGGGEYRPAVKRIGAYTIVREIAAGGMGVVYEATQQNPSRTVALKVIRPGMTEQQTLKRFQREGELLGRLHHPGIAHIYEAGVASVADEHGTVTSRPFFAMEFIKGRSLLEHADHQELDTVGRLHLLARLCDAVGHAHQQGVVHRDLKPANILVEDGATTVLSFSSTSATGDTAVGCGQPKILDFGVARLLTPDLKATLQTVPGQLIGTIAYMSPEQVLGRTAEVDARSDVYSLGVICYQLLSGRAPYLVDKLPLPQAVKTICEQEPPTIGTTIRQLRGDVEIIVRKAMDKDPSRRYESASEMAQDIRRHLSDQPIQARPPTVGYQLTKFARRHRVLVASLFVIVTLSLAFGTVSSLLYVRAESARHEAELAAIHASESAALAGAVNEFLVETLGSADPHVRGRDVTVFDTLQESLRQIDAGSLSDRPEIEASVRGVIGEIYLSLAWYEESRAQLERALAIRRSIPEFEPVVVAQLLNQLGTLFQEMDLLDKAEASFRESEQLLLSDDKKETEAYCDARGGLAWVWKSQGAGSAAEEALVELLSLRRRIQGENHGQVAWTLNDLAQIYRDRGEYQRAVPIYRQALDIARRGFGDGHLHVATVMQNLAFLYQEMREYDKAEPMFLEAIGIREKQFDPPHPLIASSLDNLGVIYRRMGRLVESRSYHERALTMRRAFFGDVHSEVAHSLNNLGSLLQSTGEFELAERYQREAFQQCEQLFANDDRSISFYCAHNLGRVLMSLQRFDEAASFLRRSRKIGMTVLGAKHPSYGSTCSELARLLTFRGEFSEAVELFRENLHICIEAYGHDHSRTNAARIRLASALLGREEHAAATEMAATALTSLDAASLPSPNLLAGALLVLSDAHVQSQDDPTAQLLLERLVKVSGQGAGVAPHIVYRSRVLLAELLARSGVCARVAELLGDARTSSMHTRSKNDEPPDAIWRERFEAAASRCGLP